MVHNLRSRNVCGTSDKRIQRVQQVCLDIGTPVTILRNANDECGDADSSFDLLTINDCNNSISLSDVEMNIFASTRIDAPELNNSDHETISTHGQSSSFSSFKFNLQAAIDETVFKNTYNNHKGVSLYAIRRGIKEFGYKKNNNQCRLYVRECLENGKFLQKSGHGANGSFRLKDTIHKSFIQAHRQNKIHKVRNENTTAVCLKRFKRHDLEISKLLRQSVRSNLVEYH